MKRILCLFLVAVLLCLCSGCGKSTTATVFAMDTVMQLQVWGPDGEKAVQEASQMIQDLENTWSNTVEDSLINRLNGGKVELSPEQQKLLEEVENLSRRTGGTFDPKLQGLIRLWGFQSGESYVPSFEETAVAQAGWNLGAAMKGYAGRQAVAILEKLNVDRAMLNLGGNIQTYGQKPKGEPWVIGIQNPDGGDPVGTVSVLGTMAVVTSGDYQRYFEQDGVRYHHILDPETGRPADSGLRSVTVICRDGLTADCLSTALFVMGLEDGITFWRQSQDFEAVFLTTDGKVYATQGAAFAGREYEVITREN